MPEDRVPDRLRLMESPQPTGDDAHTLDADALDAHEPAPELTPNLRLVQATRIFQGLSPETQAAIAGQMTQVQAQAGKVLTHVSSMPGKAPLNNLVLPEEDRPLLLHAHFPDGKDLGEVTLEPGAAFHEATWINGIEARKDNEEPNPALAARPVLSLRLREGASYRELPPLLELDRVIHLTDAEICRILTGIGTEMSSRLSELNAEMMTVIDPYRPHDLPQIDGTSPALLPILEQGQREDFKPESQTLYRGKPGRISIVRGGAWVIGTSALEDESSQEDESIEPKSVSGVELIKARLAQLGSEPQVVFAGLAMDGITRNTALVGKINTTVREYPLNPSSVVQHLALVRSITGYSAGMQRWVADQRRVPNRLSLTARLHLALGFVAPV